MHAQMEWEQNTTWTYQNIFMQKWNYGFQFMLWMGEAGFHDCTRAVFS